VSYFARAIDIIKKHEVYSEHAYPDPVTGGAPYTFGYGSQYYPDGAAVKKGQCCTKQKALEYLLNEVEIIHEDLKRLNLGLDSAMEEALISFIHSVGWDAFLYSRFIDNIEYENWPGVTAEFSRWIFDADHRVIGGLIERRREENQLFLEEIKNTLDAPGDILLRAFRNYNATTKQITAIRQLEEQLNPYILAEFANAFVLDQYCIDYLEDTKTDYQEDVRLALASDNWS
jgi:GH24 family phage-related lysozyme (muramidase)